MTFLSESQKDNGGYVSYGAEDSESCSQVMAGLTMLGIDVFTDSRFIKNGNTVFDALMRYYREDGTFAHAANGDGNAISTSQAYYAVSVLYEDRFVIYPEEENMIESSDKKSAEPSKTVEQTSVDNNTNNVPTGDTENIVLMLGAGMISASVILILAKKKKED